MAATLTQQHDPYLDGLGKASQLGVCFLRRVTVEFDATTADITPVLLGGCTKLVQVLSIVPKSANQVYVSALSESALELTADDTDAVCDVFVLVAGL